VPINSRIMYVAGSTTTGANTQSGSGGLLIVNTATPPLPMAGTLDIPGTVQALAIAVNGNKAMVVGSTGGWLTPFNDPSKIALTGNIALAILNISNPLDPTIIGSRVVTQGTFPHAGDNAVVKLQAIYLGNGQSAVSDTQSAILPVILMVNASDPNNLVTNTVSAPADINGMAVSGTASSQQAGPASKSTRPRLWPANRSPPT
jgi:hypothetical protein